MEAQKILSRLCPKTPSLLLPSHKKLHTLPYVGPKNLGILRLGCSYTEGKKKRVFCVRRTVEEEEAKEVKVGATALVRRKKLAVFVSGGGSNFKSIHEASLKGSLHGDVLVLVTNKPDCGGAEYARNNGIPVVVFPKVKDGSDGLSPSELVDTLSFWRQRILWYEGAQSSNCFRRKVLQFILLTNIMTRGVSLLNVPSLYWLMTLQTSWLPGFSRRLYVEVVEALCEERIVWREDGVPLIRSKDNPNEFC
ncbi:phosphoribosylglycinamide formyltransferase, chloroplastic isoform X3 [Arachis hypogaea]|uniref:phosphoribosylglycinamide formyltransferase, chloroplastic isoform X3 n=1 Tax=Arachis hypogaea TaxID=3818 RepID=UPI003B213B81